jgi:putative FmdB family regulatory protein
MPLYEYKCKKCGHEFEELVSFAEADKVKCNLCGGKTERLASCFASANGGGTAGAKVPPCGVGGG